jgi:hypothetical protein
MFVDKNWRESWVYIPFLLFDMLALDGMKCICNSDWMIVIEIKTDLARIAQLFVEGKNYAEF